MKYSEYILEVDDLEDLDVDSLIIKFDNTDFIAYIIDKIKRRKVQIIRCPGCYPIYQNNQLGHVGPYGCLGDYF